MAHSEETTFVDIDYDINFDRHIPDDFVNKHNVLESFEVEIPDDINVSDLEDLEDEEEDILYVLPKIQFVNEKDVTVACSAGSAATEVVNEMVCEKCGKRYKKKAFYDNHITICGLKKKKSKPGKVTKTQPKEIKRNQKKSKLKDSIILPDEEVIGLSSILIETALKSVVDNPFYQIQVKDTITPGNKVRLLAERLLPLMKERENELRAIALTTSVYEFLKTSLISKLSGREMLWRNVHKFVQDESVQSEWASILSINLPSKELNMLFRTVVMKLIELIMQHENEHRETKPNSKVHHLTSEEQQIVSYVSGFIVFSLKQKYTRLLSKGSKNNDIASAALQFLDTLRSSERDKETFLEFTKGWANLLNRGGLVIVNDDMFIFCRHIENTVRTVLTTDLIKRYRKEDIRDVIEKKIEERSLIDLAWDSISKKLVNKDLAEIIKKQIIRKWVDLRARAYVTAYIQVIKRKLANISKDKKEKNSVVLSKKGEPAMRKKLT